jgi:hypothetical protein
MFMAESFSIRAGGCRLGGERSGLGSAAPAVQILAGFCHL